MRPCRRYERVGLLAALVIFGGACSSGGGQASKAAISSSSVTTASAPVSTKGPILESPSLQVAITPNSGPPGTNVRINATGCNDPNGQNHAVSFNNSADNTAVRNDPNTVRAITSTQDGTTLTATYTIRVQDRTGGAGLFFVQCSATIKTAPFTVTAHS